MSEMDKHTVQVLVAAMNQTDHSLLDKMNIDSDVIVGNQCTFNSIEKFMYKSHNAVYLNFNERGVGLNRNNSLIRATGDICLFADDDMRYILVVDNFSTDNSVQLLSDIISEKVEVIVSNKNGGYGAGNNYGIKYLIDKYNSDYILLSNPDVIVEDETINKLEEFLRNNQDYVIAAPFMLDKYRNRQINTAFRIPNLWDYILSFDLVWSKWL